MGSQPHLERLRHHELGLRQRPLGGVDQHQCAIDHIEDALDLAAEIGVARRIDDIDPGVVPNQRGRLGENGDAALALEVVRIERAFEHALVLAERAGLLQEPVDQRGFAVVDMGDNGDVAEIHALIVKPLRAPKGPRLRPYIVRNRQEAIGYATATLAPAARGSAGLADDRGAARGDGEAQLIEREGKRHAHRLVEFLAFALMDDRNHEIVGLDLEAVDRLQASARRAPCAPDRARVAGAAAAACGYRCADSSRRPRSPIRTPGRSACRRKCRRRICRRTTAGCPKGRPARRDGRRRPHPCRSTALRS